MHISKLWMENTMIPLNKITKMDIDSIPMEIIEDTRIMNIPIHMVRIEDHILFTLINHQIITGIATASLAIYFC